MKMGKEMIQKFGFNTTDPTWEELKRLEKRRRSILLRTELPFYRIIFYWDGTCLRLLFIDPLMWLTILIFVGLRVHLRLGDPVEALIEMTEVADLSGIGAFLTFFLVFFVMQSNTRLNEQYAKSMGCKGRIFDVATMARARLPRENALRMVRYMNAAHVAAYVGISDVYSQRNFFDEINKTNILLTENELIRVNQINMDTGSSAALELISWAMMEVERALKGEYMDPRHASQFRDQILQLRANIGAIYDYKDQPVPFFYIHFLCLLSTLYLPLYAIDSAYDLGSGNDSSFAKDIYSGIILVLQTTFIIGMRLLGQKLSDPYGSDLEDLSVMHYCNFTWLMSSRILSSRRPENFESLSAARENQIVRGRVTIGAAWQSENPAHGINRTDSIESFKTVEEEEENNIENQSMISKIWNIGAANNSNLNHK